MRDFDEIVSEGVHLERNWLRKAEHFSSVSPPADEIRLLLSLFNDLVVIVAELREHKHRAPNGYMTGGPYYNAQ